MAGTGHDAARNGSCSEISHSRRSTSQTSYDGKLPAWTEHLPAANAAAENGHAAAAARDEDGDAAKDDTARSADAARDDETRNDADGRSGSDTAADGAGTQWNG